MHLKERMMAQFQEEGELEGCMSFLESGYYCLYMV